MGHHRRGQGKNLREHSHPRPESICQTRQSHSTRGLTDTVTATPDLCRLMTIETSAQAGKRIVWFQPQQTTSWQRMASGRGEERVVLSTVAPKKLLVLHWPIPFPYMCVEAAPSGCQRLNKMKMRLRGLEVVAEEEREPKGRKGPICSRHLICMQEIFKR